MVDDATHKKIYLDEGEDFSETQSFGRRVVTPVRYSTDPRDIGWVEKKIGRAHV